MGFLRRRSDPAVSPASPRDLLTRREITIPPRAAGDSPILGEPPAALAIPTVFRCASLLAHTVGNLPVTVRLGTERVPSPRWIRYPQSFGGPSMRHLFAQTVTDMALFGSAYWYAEPFGVSWRITPVPANTVGVSFDTRGRRVYRVAGEAMRLLDPGSEQTRALGGLIPLPFLIVSCQAAPVGPIGAARLALAGFLDTDRFASRVFASGRGQTGGRLETDQDITAETAARYRDQWIESQAQPLTSSIPVLGNGLRYATDSIDPKDAQWIEARSWNAGEIARLFGVPARYLGLPSGDSVTYATARDNDAAFIRGTLAPYIAEIEAALSALLPFGRTDAEEQIATLSTESLLRSTTEDRWAAYQTAIAAGFLTVDEIRAQEGLPPLAETAEPAEEESADA